MVEEVEYYNDLDYDIENYTLEELQNFFKLKKNSNYGIEEIDKNYEYLYNNSPNDQLKIFLLKAKELITKDFYSRKIDNYIDEQKTLDIELNKYKTTQSSILVPDIKPVINGSDYNYICKKLVINSKFRKDFTTTNSNDFTINLPYLFKNVVSLEFKSMEYCNSIYSITSKLGNNTFIIDNIEYVIPDGNYTNTSLLDYINSIIPSDIDISYNENTGKTTIYSKTNTIINIIFGIDNIYEDIECVEENTNKRLCPETKKLIKSYNMYDTLGYILGFRNFEYNSLSSYTSESILDVKGFRYIYLYVDDYINSSSYDTLITINSKEGDYFSSKILARIANTEDNYHIKYQDSSDTIDRKRFYYGPVNIQKLRFQLLNDKGTLIDNNNTDFSVMLELKMINK
jgi:hypothetical protein